MTPTEQIVVGPSGFPTNPTSVSGHGYLLAEAKAKTPGRISDGDDHSGDKPEQGSTPWLSLFFVTARHSADGNGYAVGETIPELEAIRQGVYVPQPGTEDTPEEKRQVCVRCLGTGNYSKAKPKNHPPDHANCVFCGPCPVCEGAKYVVVQEG